VETNFPHDNGWQNLDAKTYRESEWTDLAFANQKGEKAQVVALAEE
jgi:hypothetical protein